MASELVRMPVGGTQEFIPQFYSSSYVGWVTMLWLLRLFSVRSYLHGILNES